MFRLQGLRHTKKNNTDFNAQLEKDNHVRVTFGQLVFTIICDKETGLSQYSTVIGEGLGRSTQYF